MVYDTKKRISIITLYYNLAQISHFIGKIKYTEEDKYLSKDQEIQIILVISARYQALCCVSIQDRLLFSKKVTHCHVSSNVHKPDEFRMRYTWNTNCDTAVSVEVMEQCRMSAMPQEV